MIPDPHTEDARALPRELYRPSATEKRHACETLLRCDLPSETRAVVRQILENSHGTENHPRI